MPKIAVMEDDLPTGESFASWLGQGIPAAQVLRYETLEACEAALREHSFDLVVLDIALGIKRHAGIELMKQIDHLKPVPPVLVVSGLPPEHYRGVTKALGAWDFLQKPCQAHDLIAAVGEILADAGDHSQIETDDLKLDPLNQKHLLWKEQRVNVTLTGMRILNLLLLSKGQPVAYSKLFEAVKTGATEDNVRKHISAIRGAFKEVDPTFDRIKVVPQFGFMWTVK